MKKFNDQKIFFNKFYTYFQFIFFLTTAYICAYFVRLSLKIVCLLSRDRLTLNVINTKNNYGRTGEIIFLILILDTFSLFLMSF